MPIIAWGIVGRRVDEPEIAWPNETPAVKPAADDHLTSRELEILHLPGDGRSTGELPAALHVSPRTISSHIANILAKMDVTSRTAAVARALRDGVIHASQEG